MDNLHARIAALEADAAVLREELRSVYEVADMMRPAREIELMNELSSLRRKVAAADGMAKTLDSLSHQLGQARQSSPRDMLSTVCVALGAVNEARAAWQEANRG